MAQVKDKEAKDVGESSSKAGTKKALKPKAKITKKSPNTNPTKNTNPKSTPQVQGEKNNRWKKKKFVTKENKETRIILREDDKKTNSNETKERSKEKPSWFQKKQKNEKKKEKTGSGFETRRSQMYKEKRTEAVPEKNNKKQQTEKNKEKLGGLILMCNEKTKPDCFRYQVMGVPLNKKHLLLRVKPGLKLFLYDFDLRLLYGIYKAASSGGVRLEPTAFAGAFPVQVRFAVDQDCYPVAESVFKSAIKENYNSPSKFRTDLTPEQVKRLIELFRPVGIPSNTPAVIPQQMVMMQHSYPVPPQENTPAVVPQQMVMVQHSYAMAPQENSQHLAYNVGPIEKDVAYLTEKEYRAYGLRREIPNLTPPQTHVAPTLEPYPPRIQVTEQSLRYPPSLYRATAISSLEPTPPTTLIEHHPMRHPSTIYGEMGPPQGEPTRHDPLLLSERDHYAPSHITPHHHYESYYATPAADPHSPPPSSRVEVLSGYYPTARRESYGIEALPRRETYLTEAGSYLSSSRGGHIADSDSLRRREHDDGGNMLYTARASSALSDYNRVHNYMAAQPETSSFTTSVSARYSFAGPSLYR